MTKYLALAIIFLFSTAATWQENEPREQATGSSFQTDQLANNIFLKATFENIGTGWNDSDHTAYDLTVNGVTPTTGKFYFHNTEDGVYLSNGTNLNDITMTEVGGVGFQSITIGHDAGESMGAGAQGNTVLGDGAAKSMTIADQNTCVGLSSCNDIVDTNGNVCLGYGSCFNNTEAGRLYIANSATTLPLISGNFSQATITFNATVNTAQNATVGGSLYVTKTAKFKSALFNFSGSNLQQITMTSGNTCVGEDSCLDEDNAFATDNVCIGKESCKAVNGVADSNTCLGPGACINMLAGSSNVCIGSDACDNLNHAASQGNVILGDSAASAFNSKLVDRLIIDSGVGGRIDPLVDGSFANQTLTFNTNTVSILGGRIESVTVVSATELTLDATHYVVYVSPPDGSWVLNLPNGVTGTHYKLFNQSSNTISINPDDSDVMNGGVKGAAQDLTQNILTDVYFISGAIGWQRVD